MTRPYVVHMGDGTRMYTSCGVHAHRTRARASGPCPWCREAELRTQAAIDAARAENRVRFQR